MIEQAIYNLEGLYRRYGYLPYKMSRFEEYELYVRNKDFLVSDQIITFSDRSGRLLAMKPDVTLSIVKNAPEEPGVVQKVYYHENVYRDYREILQAGLECVGDLGAYEIAEVVVLAARSLGMVAERFVLDISHVGLIGAMLDGCGLSPEGKLLASDCLRRKNLHELKALCENHPGAWERLKVLSLCRGSGPEVLPKLEEVAVSEEEKTALQELRALWEILDGSGWGKHIRFDFSVGNDMRYYSGVVFRGYLEGVPTGVLSGGQYDRLPRKMGRKARAIGFAIYADQLPVEDGSFDVDTLILHDGTVSPAELTRAAREAEQTGTVLVSRTVPQGRNYKTLLDLRGGGDRG